MTGGEAGDKGLHLPPPFGLGLLPPPHTAPGPARPSLSLCHPCLQGWGAWPAAQALSPLSSPPHLLHFRDLQGGRGWCPPPSTLPPAWGEGGTERGQRLGARFAPLTLAPATSGLGPLASHPPLEGWQGDGPASDPALLLCLPDPIPPLVVWVQALGCSPHAAAVMVVPIRV